MDWSRSSQRSAFYCRSLVEVEAPGSRVNTWYRNPTEVVLETEAEDGNYVFAIASYATLQKDMEFRKIPLADALRGYSFRGKTKRGGRAFGRELRYMISPVKMAEDSRSQRISTIFIILWRSHPEAVICRGTEDCCSAPAETSKCGVHSTVAHHPVIMPH
ncbi:MAG: hypothetical protein ACLR6I_00730 [Waltera sp.]